ncbi:potassium channel family protein [Actinacidiphila acididurans]|uniref:Potassium channel family protein n=1 Tax=Actinacidiphila acididurans TaxID=2784346 RepID=A0ABS2U3M7_9ACTN|nr:potassium channel family protein [Actinacidiphila acididurans]MBM9509791.1 potassium channel family protein [Actinacidiphila acididurans]
MDADSRLSRWENRTEVPLFVTSLVYLGAYAVHVLDPGLPVAVHDALRAVIGLTWSMFVADYVVRWRLSGHPFLPGYMRHHFLDTVVVVLPLLRPLRAVHLYEVIQRRRAQPRLSLYGRVIAYAGMTALLLGFSASLAVYQQERGAPHATIRTFGDSVWWACSTLTTVGYGDVTPVTPGGRSIAAVLMFLGLALLGAVTGSFSSWLLQVFTREDEKPPGGFPGAS